MQVVLSLGEDQLGKKLVRPHWEKAAYWLLLTLANTLLFLSVLSKIIFLDVIDFSLRLTLEILLLLLMPLSAIAFL